MGYVGVMEAVTARRQRVRREIAMLGHRGLDVTDFGRAICSSVAHAVPCEGTCLLTLDPATLLPTGEVTDNGLPAAVMPRMTEIELRERDVNKFTALARANCPAASLSEATAGDLDNSLRQRELRRPSGFADELRVVLADASGTWGALTLLRQAGRPHFTLTDVRFVASLASAVADGLRRAALLADATAGNDGETGLLVLAPDEGVELANTAAGRWLEELTVGTGSGPHLPTAIRAVASRARGSVDDGADGGAARARVRTRAGHWLMVRGSLLGEGPDARVAVLLEAARPAELAPLIADAYALTPRERRITELVARGHATAEIAAALHLSPYTVQDHLKSIFEKTGAGSRGGLVARLFFDHYEPRLRSR